MSGNVQRFIVLLSPRDRLLLDLVAGHYQRSRGDTLRVLVRQVAAKYGIRLPETETADGGDVGGMVHRVVGRGDAGASIAHMAPEGGRDASA